MKFKTFKRCGLLLMAIVSITACNDDNEEPTKDTGIEGKWQKYQVLDDEGNFTEGDLDEFWIFNVDGSFENEDGGTVTTTGYYTVDGNRLMIYSRSVDDQDEEENFSGNYVLDNNYMIYSFIDLNNGDTSTIRFKRL